MTLTQQIQVQAQLLAGELDARQQELLKALCTAVSAGLQSRLREGLSPEDCKADFIAAASLMALAALNSVDENAQVEQITAADFTVRKASPDAASHCLQAQAELMMAPYLKDRFSFMGV